MQKRNPLGCALRRLRRDRGLSQEDFAEACGVHRNYVGRVERGEVEPSLGHLQSLARGARISASDLLKLAGL